MLRVEVNKNVRGLEYVFDGLMGLILGRAPFGDGSLLPEQGGQGLQQVGQVGHKALVIAHNSQKAQYPGSCFFHI